MTCYCCVNLLFNLNSVMPHPSPVWSSSVSLTLLLDKIQKRAFKITLGLNYTNYQLTFPPYLTSTNNISSNLPENY